MRSGPWYLWVRGKRLRKGPLCDADGCEDGRESTRRRDGVHEGMGGPEEEVRRELSGRGVRLGDVCSGRPIGPEGGAAEG